jgi:hypothetical protein
MADKPTKDDDANSRFVWQPGDIVILPPPDPAAKAIIAELGKLAQPDRTQKGELT